ncbi:hypothetical protein A1353_18935 [Methylomonas methanica]|uniref:Uncharacterized protein n=1 Tax=Methylomonas methanica TaxID=421 RepID=A0A177M582_METMH|nr:hypothetical protein [Methylomonas methanica]OAI00887.1 hypothetical protein A1353_18935 [Methylomonas methanica]
MAKVVKFPNANVSTPGKKILDITRRSAVTVQRGGGRFLPWCGRATFGLFGFLIEFLRAVVLTLLLWFRPILFVVIRPLSGFLLIAFIICLFTHPANPQLVWIFGVACFAAFWIMYLYDWALMRLSRGNIVNVLN